nr:MULTISPECIES: hypothetical protein [unclassified Pseudomonas]
MNDFDAKRQQILDAFGIGNVASAAGNSSVPLRCYQVGDCDWFAATSSEQALELMREMVGDEDWGCKPESPKILSEKVAGEVSGC